ncbi:Hypothetical predicted protein [Cloeon dipterum]|uniref:Uncharacterized protein n=1 Tax=Cloeon dipterum TaxID=197152 RepID=A0A8S1E610_9INSE|nr:Hypothetical predicted protein [Cloeon dipterum]
MATYMNAPGTHHQRCKVEVGCGYITELRFCSQNILKKACPALCHEIENHHIHESLPIRIHGSPAAFDAAIRFLSDTFQENLHLDEVKAIELLDFAWKYESLELQKAAESLCLQTDFANLDGLGLINYHSSFLTHKLWSGKEDREKELLEEISRRGAEVLKYLSASKKMCFDTVKKILEQPRLNVFKEKDVLDRINAWRINITNAVEKKEYGNDEFITFQQRCKDELLPLIRFEFFGPDDVNKFFDETTSSLSFTEKMALVKTNPPRNINDPNWLLPTLTLSGEEYSPDGGLNLEYLSAWRGYFIPFTQRLMLLKSEEDILKILPVEQTFNIQPLKRDLYLLSVRLYNLEGLHRNRETKLVSFSVAVIRQEGKLKQTESISYFKWRMGQSKYFKLSHPCLLKKACV